MIHHFYRARRSSDPYARSYDRHLDRGKSKSRKDSERMMLTPTRSTDQAYETMYDDDEILGNPQTMPWFDPNYLATNPEDVSLAHENEMNVLLIYK